MGCYKTIKTYLHLAIDDASGRIVGGYFDYQNKKMKDMAEDTMTQYQQVCRTFGIDLQCSSIPQFKPRVKRSFKTLQGRLPFELKEAGVTTLEQANEFLTSYIQKFNQQFAIIDGIESCLAGQPTKEQIDQTLVTFPKRVVDSGNAIRINNKNYATFDKNGEPIFIKPKTAVTIITMMNGSMFALHNDLLLVLEEIPFRQKVSVEIDFEKTITIQKKKTIPAYDSIWRISNENLFKKRRCFY